MRDNSPLDVDLSDIDFDDDEESTVTPAPSVSSPASLPAADRAESIDIQLSNLHKSAPENAGARTIASKLEDALLPLMSIKEADRLSELEVASLIARQHLQDALNEKNPEPTVVDAARSLYKKRLIDQLGYAAYLKTRYSDFLPTASAGLQRLDSSDPLLSRQDVSEVNGSKPPYTNEKGAKVGFIDKKRARPNNRDDRTDEAKYLSVSQLEERGRRLSELAAKLNLPTGWEADTVDPTEMSNIKGLTSRTARAAAYRAMALKARPNHVVVRPTDPDLKKHAILFEANQDATKLVPTQQEVEATIAGFNDFTDVFDIAALKGLRDDSEINKYGRANGGLQIMVGTHENTTYWLAGLVKQKGTNGVFAPSGDIFINLGNIRNYDDAQYLIDNNVAGHFAIEPEGALDKLSTTTIHEMGHAVHAAITSEQEMDRLRVPGTSTLQGENEVTTRYAATKGVEQFAEALLFYVRTGKIAPRIRQQLVQHGVLLK